MRQDLGESDSEPNRGGGQDRRDRGLVKLRVAGTGGHPSRCEQTELGHPVSLLHLAAMHVLVVRHGITAWNAAGRWQGWEDVPLSPEGEAQADRAGTILRAVGPRFDRVVASDLLRARQTAERIVAALGQSAVTSTPYAIEVVEGLRERDIGAWSGKLTAEIEAQWPGWLDAWRRGELDRPPEGEYEPEFRARISTALEAIATTGQRTLVVTHGGVIRTLEVHYGTDPAPVANVSGRWFGVANGRVTPGDRVDLASAPSASPFPDRSPVVL